MIIREIEIRDKKRGTRNLILEEGINHVCLPENQAIAKALINEIYLSKENKGSREKYRFIIDSSKDEPNNPGLCMESKACSVFTEKSFDYSERLIEYLMYDDEYGKKHFSNVTDGMGITGVFRAYLREYIKETSNKNIRYYIGDSKKEKANHMRTSIEEQFKNYLLVNKFWEGVCELRSLHISTMPLIIYHPELPITDNKFLELLSETNRQVIIFDRVPKTVHN